ncbi:MAG: DUF2298 domain-containing protein, partial [Thermomicrobiales bacterium]
VEGAPAAADPFLFWTWRGSRSIADAITEFPYFSGLYADLHAHVIALPLTVAAIALSLAVASGGLFSHFGGQPRFTRAGLARLAVLALLIGSLSATNAWDVPVYAALAVTAIFMATSSMSRRQRILMFAGTSVAWAVVAWLLFLPFHRHFVALFGQLALVRDPTDLLQFLTHAGGLLAICVLGLTALLMSRGSRSLALSIWPWMVLASAALGMILLSAGAENLAQIGFLLLAGAFAAPPLVAAWLLASEQQTAASGPSWPIGALLLAVSVVATASVLNGRAVFGLLLAVGCAAAVGWLRLEPVADRFTGLLLAAGCFTAAGVEIVVVADDLIGTPAYRMNTVFKFYNQVWVLLALAGSAFVALMIRESTRAIAARSLTHTDLPGRRAWSRVGLATATLILLAALAYPAMATGPRLAQRFTPGTRSGTLDALAWMEAGSVPVLGNAEYAEITYASDAAAIDWLLTNVSGTPVIAEASIGPYRCHGSRISSATGLPTIIGWERHQQQQRYPEALPKRVEDVRTLYTSTDMTEKTSILRRYNVEFIVVGDLERLYPIANNECAPTGSAAGIAAFEAMLGTTLAVAHSSGGTTIYRVLPIGAA